MMKAKSGVKLKRRLTLLGVVLLLGGGSLAGAYKYRRHQVHKQMVAWRTNGIAASKAGNYAGAVDNLGNYLRANSDDAEVLFYYIQARPFVESPESPTRPLEDTVYALKALLRLYPDRRVERRELLDLYVKLGYGAEAIDSADILLKQDPNDDAALRGKVVVLARLREWRKALPVSLHWSEVSPMDPEAQMETLLVMHEVETPAIDLVARAASLRRTHPDDPRFEMLEGYALWLTGLKSEPRDPKQPKLSPDGRSAAEWLTTAASRPPTDATFARMLVSQLENQQLYDASLDYLRKVAGTVEDASLLTRLTQRLWESGRWAELAGLAGRINPDDRKTPNDQIAMLASAQLRLDRKAEAARLRDVLTRRAGVGDGKSAAALSASAWLARIDASGAPGPESSARVLTACRAALVREPNNPYFQYFVAEAEAERNELETAIGGFRRAAQQDFSWALPAARLADLLLSQGRLDLAMDAASEAMRRATTRTGPGTGGTVNDLQVALSWARVMAAGAEAGRPVPEQELDRLTASVQKVQPGEEYTLAIELARRQRSGDHAGAVGALKTVLDAKDLKCPPTRQAWLRFAALSQSLDLGLETECFDRCEHDFGISPDLAFARAMYWYGKGQAARGQSSLESDRRKAQAAESPNGGSDLQWQLAWARYLDLTVDPHAAANWTELADSHPQDLTVQKTALMAPSVQADRAFMDRTIERVRALTGDNGVAWRIGRARWLLGASGAATSAAPSPDAARMAQEATDLLNEVLRSSPDSAEAHFLLARALLVARNTTGAIQHLDTATQLNPESAEYALALVSQFQSNGEFDRAREQLNRVVNMRLLDPRARREAALLWMKQGDSSRALALLEKSFGAGQVPDLLAATLYRQKGETAKAEAIIRALMAAPDAAVIEFAADFYAAQGRTDEAERTLASMDSLKPAVLKPGVKELIRAGYAARYGTPEQATGFFRAATTAAPSNPATWRAWAAYEVALNHPDEAAAAVNGGLAAVPGDASMQALHEQFESIKAALAEPSLRSYALLLAQNPAASNPALDVIRIRLDAQRQHQAPDQTVTKLRQVADRNPGFLPLHADLISGYLSLHRNDEAAVVGSAAMQRFPNAPEPAQMMVELTAATGRWSEMLNYATLWRKRVVAGSPLPADVAIAEAQLNLQHPAEAVKQLAPYEATAFSNPEANEVVIIVYSAALIANRQAEKEGALLVPVLQKNKSLRVRWLGYVARNLSESDVGFCLQQLTPLVPPDSTDEQIAIAELWQRLGAGKGQARYLPTARQILQRLIDSQNVSAQACLAMGSLCEQENDLPGAERFDRQALTIEPANPVAHNNLAMVLVKKGGPAAGKEALDHAAAAVKGLQVGPTYDTLGAVQAVLKDYAAALQSIDSAIKLSPSDPHYQLMRIKYLIGVGRRDEAAAALTDFRTNVTNVNALEQGDRDELLAIQGSLKKGSTQTSSNR